MRSEEEISTIHDLEVLYAAGLTKALLNWLRWHVRAEPV